jgi:signal transduction histidine kinase
LLGALEDVQADLGWVAWSDANTHLVLARPDGPVVPASIGEFPEPPERPLIVKDGHGAESWTLWCRSRGILSCIVVPLAVNGRAQGTVGLASATVGTLGADHLGRLRLVAYVLGTMRDYEARMASLQGLFDEVNRALENALAIDRAMRTRPSYRTLARAVGSCLDASYCQIAIRESGDCLRLAGSGGRRPPDRPAGSWPLVQLARSAQAMGEGRGVVVRYERPDSAADTERRAFLSPLTRSVIILPFAAGPRSQGVLLVGEERESRCPPLGPERVRVLELVASRLGDIMEMSRTLERDRRAARRRDRQMAVERQRLAREVHDEVGQSLTVLLVHIRNSIAQGGADPEELCRLERMAQEAMKGARAVAYGIRQLGREGDPLVQARRYAETLLQAARCNLSWLEEPSDVRVPVRIAREIGRVINESITNIVRHAQAGEVRVNVAYPPGRIQILIHDDGIGFSSEQASLTREGRGLGLLGNMERLARIGGIFDLCSSPDGGTSVVVEAPLRLPGVTGAA